MKCWLYKHLHQVLREVDVKAAAGSVQRPSETSRNMTKQLTVLPTRLYAL